jgi:hypothetical protein
LSAVQLSEVTCSSWLMREFSCQLVRLRVDWSSAGAALTIGPECGKLKNLLLEVVPRERLLETLQAGEDLACSDL